MRWCNLINPHLEAALAWHDAGCAVIPASTDGKKKPTVNWTAFYKDAPPTRQQIIDWYTEHPDWGVGLLPGKFSNGLEMSEIEACRMGGEYLDLVQEAMFDRGVGETWSKLLESGYSEATPSGGMHVLYRVENVDIPGNHKLATDTTGTITYAETRGTGGFVIVAPTSGRVHPTGESWTVLSGQIGVIPVISWDERCAIHEALTAALNERVREPFTRTPAAPRTTPTGEPASLRPGDDFNLRGDSWYDLLTRNGWSFHSSAGGQEFFTRPGKDPRDGHSAATNHNGLPGLYAWSGMPQERAYDKFGALVELEFDGQFADAVKYLAAQGYGDQKEFKPVSDMSDWATIKQPEPVTARLANGQEVTFESRDASTERESKPRIEHFTEKAVGKFMADVFGDRFRRVFEEQGWRFYDNGRWSPDTRNRVAQAASKTSDILDRQVAAIRVQAEEAEAANHPDLKKIQRSADQAAAFAKSVASDRGMKAIASIFSTHAHVSVQAGDFDTRTELLAVDNGTFNLVTGQLQEHSPQDMLTKRIGVTYDPEAVAPRWTRYLEEALPDPEQRRYIQRAVGMTILAKMEDAAFFVLHGLTGCGKSQFVKVMSAALGEYAAEAAPSTFQAARFGETAGPGDDLHDLKGVRFASVSETEEGAILKEALLKRVTGGDVVKSRALYQSFVSWRPQFTVWMMTNHKPKLSSTDGAIWRRVKPIHFPMNFSSSPNIELGLAEKIIATELAGVFNWVLEGVREYQRIGLAEPAETTAAIADYRAEVDPVQTFLTEACEEGRIVVDPTAKITSRELFNVYSAWCQDNNIRYPMAERKFGQRLGELGFEADRGSGGIRMRRGIKLAESWLIASQTPAARTRF